MSSWDKYVNATIAILITIGILMVATHFINLNKEHYSGGNRELMNTIVKDFKSECDGNWTVYLDNLDTPNDEHVKIYNGKLCEFNILPANMGATYMYTHGRVTAVKNTANTSSKNIKYNLSYGRMSI
ncbi:MAG: hypothetical protein KAJ40_02360 [Alphaproteobacteria bacterium]|nr:hypothetical protein [Alphaproteobacteria bacterium]